MMDGNAGRKLGSRSIWGIVILGVLLIVMIFAILWFFTPLGKPVPTITIIQPETKLLIQSGDAINLIALSESQNGFSHYEFQVDDLTVGTQTAEDPAAREDRVVFAWSANQPGIHKLGVLVVNSTGQSSEPAEVLVAVQQRWTTTVNVLPNPDGGEAEDEGEVSESESSSENEEEENIDEQLDADRADLQQALDEVSMDDEFPISIGISAEDTLPQIIRFEITTSLNGDSAEVALSVRASDDTGLVSLTFSLANLDDPLHPVIQQHVCGGNLDCEFDDLLTLEEGGWFLAVQALDVSGQVSERHIRQVHVLSGEEPPAIAEDVEAGMIHLNPNLSWEEVMTFEGALEDIGNPVVVEYGCSGQIVYLEVPYIYLSDHGSDVYVGATAESGNIMVAAGHALIHPGVGVARIEMEAIAPELANQTDSLKLYLRAGGNYFYEEEMSLDIFWSIPQPDLTITYVDQAFTSLRVDIRNMGCAAVDGFWLKFALRTGQEFAYFVDHYLAQGITYTWEADIDPNLYGQGFEALVDPLDLVVEINEENNSKSLLPLTVSHVEFYKIDIHDISEGYGRGINGEFIFFVDLYDDDFFSYKFPPYWEGYYVLNGGEHTLFHSTDQGLATGIYAYPYLSWDQDLTVRFTVYEDDDYGSDDLGDVVMTFPADFYNENSWKRGVEYSAMSDKGFYTIYFRIVLADRLI